MKITSEFLYEFVNGMFSFNTIVKKMRLNCKELKEEVFVYGDCRKANPLKYHRLLFLKPKIFVSRLLMYMPAVHNQLLFELSHIISTLSNATLVCVFIFINSSNVQITVLIRVELLSFTWFQHGKHFVQESFLDPQIDLVVLICDIHDEDVSPADVTVLEVLNLFGDFFL